MRFAALAILLAVLACAPAQSELVWSDGTVDPGREPTGKLLSDNESYWGNSVLTGVTYSYESPAQAPADLLSDNKTFGRRLLDGWVSNHFLCPVGESTGQPLVVVFDFKRPCRFSEVDTISTRTPKTSLKLEVRNTQADKWKTVYDQPLEKLPGKSLNRVKLRGNPRGRYLRLSLGSDTVTYIDEALVWGDAEVSDKYPEATNNVTKAVLAPPGSLASIPGIPATYCTLSRFRAWQASLGERQMEKAVWSILPGIPGTTAINRPILPSPSEICESLSFTMATNEIERVPVALTNTSSTRIASVEVEAEVVVKSRSLLRRAHVGVATTTSPAKGIELKLLVGGAMPFSKEPNDVRLLPFFEKGNMLGRGLMERYLTNGDQVYDFPKLKLPPGGSAVMWLSVETKGAAPGKYETEIGCRGGRPVKISVEVLDVKLPTPDVWITGWGSCTNQYPFESTTRIRTELATNRRLGINVFRGDDLPTPGSKAEIFRQMGKSYFHTRVLLNTPYMSSGWNGSLKVEDIKEEDEAKIAEAVKRLVEQTKSLGLTYDDWFTELWDEPGITNADVYGKIAGIVKKTDPNVNIYMNPLMWFWSPTEQQIIDALKPYYNDLIDISLPDQRLVGDNTMTKDLWAAPRLVRGSYVHPPSKAGRGMTWKSFKYNLNGWAYFSYYYPRGNPWDVSTWVELDMSYLMVLSGPNGPILTPVYEDMREGWEDYRMLSALREKGKADVVMDLLRGYDSGRPFAELRVEALRALCF